MGQSTHGFQETGNPVLDSTVNIIAAASDGLYKQNPADLAAYFNVIHELVLEAAKKEPGGLRAHGTNGHLDILVPGK